ncbi:substrate-binding domain-containing protein [Pseudonocardia phyllosphaerae]|uniref:substrate-binding domain-containing protein n=1 Tax=Pseudonocardia phyllosphaerae TaxID=3390502 RepID=UPI00397B5F9F
MDGNGYRAGGYRVAERAADGADDVLTVAFVVPGQGPSGIYGPSCRASGELSAAEINEAGGILSRRVELHAVDGGRSPGAVADEVERLTATGRADAVVGWHTSAVRRSVADRLRGSVPYVYTAVYEGGERAPGVYLTGETPGAQLRPALHWMRTEAGVRSWTVVGSDYIWPRASARAAAHYADELGLHVDREIFVPLGTRDFSDVVAGLRDGAASGVPGGVLMFLLGSDAVAFNREFARAGLAERMVRLSPLMDENMLMGSAPEDNVGVHSVAGYFETLGSPCGLDFERRYVDRLGAGAPALTSPGESCFEGLTLLARLAETAGSLDPEVVAAASGQVPGYQSPRGAVRLHDRHLVQQIYLARAGGLQFDVLTDLDVQV